ncbi:hypothetical protein EJP69_14990 [Variovorax gossypii]|uniref:Uncharacterized protein n=1 Tax=Variovorax gossypii TaxID=1679495 RepID=A0A431TIY7_9BURK|nr:hypothetical protein [Variovorax gossypii]RTQ33678.1 hypothetical protein EJP69_14990 [Variovorax gossypii]
MSESIEVMAVLLPSGSQDVRVRVRWILREDSTGDVMFPLPEDSFLVELVQVGSSGVVDQRTVFPHPYVMLDPPRTLVELAKMPDGQPYSNLLPSPHPWRQVDPAKDDLTAPDNSTLALGIAHLLGHSSPAHVHRQLVDLAANALRSMGREGMRAGTSSATAEELKAWAELFATLVRRFPGHASELRGHVRSRLKSFGRIPTTAEVFPWVEKILPVDAAASARAFAAQLSLLSIAGAEAARIAGDAANIRGLMGMRTVQGGELLDYWCDAALTMADQPTQVCPPARQGARVVAAEAFGLGTDFQLSSGQTGKDIKVRVTRQRPAELKKSGFYSFSPDLPFDKCKAGTFRLRKHAFDAVRDTQVGDYPPPDASKFSAWVDYDIVSSFQADKGHEFTADDFETMFLRAKPVTGDGLVGLRVVRRKPPAPAADYDYAFNVYCLWEGASKAMQKYFDQPETQPPIDELRPFLVTRRYSFRRDLAGNAFQDPGRIAALRVLDDPPHEALLGRPTAIEQSGTAVAYPTPTATEQCAQLSISLRDIFPANGAPPEVRWEKQGGGRPDQFDAHGIWTVEKTRPGTGALPDSALPQRYRLWITGVDVFGQESAPVPAVGSEPPDEHGPARTIFVPRWRSAPSAADETTCARDGEKLVVQWKVAPQELIGSSVDNYYRLPLKAEIVMMRRPIRDIQKPTASSLTAEQGELNAVLARRVDARAAEGWEVWGRTCADVKSPVAQKVEFALSLGDKGYDYVALISHAVPDDRSRFVQQDSVQRVRYLRRSTGADGKDRFDEDWWAVPAQGAGSQYRNHPRFSPCAESQAVTAPPPEDKFPPLDLQAFAADLVRAKPVQGVVGVDRDQVLAKIIELKDLDDQHKERGTARRLLIETAIRRLEAPAEHPTGLEQLLDNLFTREAAQPREKSHPIIGFRGAVRLKWSAKRRTDAVPVAQYRVYTARCPWPLPDTSPVATLANGVLAFEGGKPPASVTARPQFVVLHELGGGTWTGLAFLDGASVKVKRLQSAEFLIPSRGDPPAGVKLQVALAGAELTTACEGPLSSTSVQDYEVTLPVGGGYREFGAWWLCAADCTNKETWWDVKGEPKFFGLALAATIAPLPIQSLRAAGATQLLDAVHRDDFEKWRDFLPSALPKDGLALFPRTVVSWDADEVRANEQYIFVERQTQAAEPARAVSRDPAWALLRAIQAAPVGSPWDDQYKALRQWLLGESSPVPDDDFEPDTRRFFFKLDTPVGWALRNAAMTRDKQGAAVPATFVDYFDLPPIEGGGVQPSLGEVTVRYRAFKAIDLMPDAGQPMPDQFDSRFLLSTPSAWTGWVRPEWPQLTISHTTKPMPRDGKPLVTFGARSEFAGASLVHSRVATDPFFFRVALRREMAQALAPSAASKFDVLVGELMQVPLAAGSSTLEVRTQDDSLERHEPATPCAAIYRVVSELVWRDAGANGGERVLRMFDEPHLIAVAVPVVSGAVEARLDIELKIVVGSQ